MRDIPSIDIAQTTARTMQQVEAACRDVGFMYVRGHGIKPGTISRVRYAVVEYFARPLREKLGDRISSDNYRGYIPQGFFSANSGDRDADLYEGYKLHFEVGADDPVRQQCDLYGPNKWPAAADEFRTAILDYWQACDRVANTLLGMLATILEVDAESLLALFSKPLTNMTLLHYPPQAALPA